MAIQVLNNYKSLKFINNHNICITKLVKNKLSNFFNVLRKKLYFIIQKMS